MPKRGPIFQRSNLCDRLVALRYPTAADGIDHFNTSLPELVRFLGSEVAMADTRFVAEEGSLGSFAFDDPLLLMITGNRAVMRVSDSQKRMLGDYLKKGGMLFAEDVRAPIRGASSDVGRSGTPFDRMLKSLLADPLVLGNAGKMWRPVPRDHQLYQAFFAFPDGPPMSGTVGGRFADARITDLEMLEYRGRVAVVFSDLNISFAWSKSDAIGRQRALQFGSNLVIFTLVQYATVGSARR